MSTAKLTRISNTAELLQFSVATRSEKTKKSEQTSVVFITHALLQFKVGIHAWKQQCTAVLGNVMRARTPTQTTVTTALTDTNRITVLVHITAQSTYEKTLPSLSQFRLAVQVYRCRHNAAPRPFDLRRSIDRSRRSIA